VSDEYNPATDPEFQPWPRRVPTDPGWGGDVPSEHEQLRELVIERNFIDRLLKLTYDYDDHWNTWWNVRDGQVRWFTNVNDVFYWGTADAERITAEDLDDLEQAYKDAEAVGSYRGGMLWACRKRGMRPQTPYFKYFSLDERDLFLACGPEREDQSDPANTEPPDPPTEAEVEQRRITVWRFITQARKQGLLSQQEEKDITTKLGLGHDD
jgi:hypothetical protein